MRGEHAQMPNLRREEPELLERSLQVHVVRMALDLGIELRRRKRAADLVALQLRHVDAVGRKPAHRLVERRRNVAHAKDKRGHPVRPFGLFRNRRVAAHAPEAAPIVRVGLGFFPQEIQAINSRPPTPRASIQQLILVGSVMFV